MCGNIIAGAVVILLVTIAITSVIKNRKQGKCCGCSGSCPNHKECGRE